MSQIHYPDIDAILIDTNIYHQLGYNFTHPKIKSLEQFKDTNIKLIITDMIRYKIEYHLTEDLINNKLGSFKTMESTISKITKHNLITNEDLKDLKRIYANLDPKKLASQQLNKFIEQNKILEISCDKFSSLSNILQRYYDLKPPFETRKKSEFPDAFTLDAVNNWAISNNKKVLGVSNDKGWQDYANELSNINCIDDDDLTEFLDEINSKREDYNLNKGQILGLIINTNSDLYCHLHDFILDDLESSIEDFEYCSAQNFDVEPDFGLDISICSLSFYNDYYKIIKDNIDTISLELKADITIRAVQAFSISVYDRIDGDTVHIGDTQGDEEYEFNSNIIVNMEYIGEYTSDDHITRSPSDNFEENWKLVSIKIVNPPSIDFGEIDLPADYYE